MSRRIRRVKFRDLSLDDPFFDSLKQGYTEFPNWFKSKANEDLYVVSDGSQLSGMIYLKKEVGPVTDIEPPLPNSTWLKVGTLKILGQGTKLGERVIKKIFDTAFSEGASGIYVTIFEVQQKLVDLFKRYGFVEYGTKETSNGIELVLFRDLTKIVGDILLDYPLMSLNGRRIWLLAIYPDYHTRLLPDSILRNEPEEIVQDVSYTNTIHKVYIARLVLTRMSRGDVVIFYRTNDEKGPAHYRSVVTSICVVEEVRRKRDFASVEDFIAYARPRSVFSEAELRERFTADRLYIAKMTYNAAFNRRVTRGRLLDEGVVTTQPRWDMRELTRTQLDSILEMGQVNARLVVD